VEDEEDDVEEYGGEDDVPISQRAGGTPTEKPVRPSPRPQHQATGRGGRPHWERGAKKKEDNSVKWTTLSHNGVIFPPPYTPHGVRDSL